jgi:uncharacterized membrane protein
MKRNFLTGLAILLPMALTLWILSILINMLTYPFVGLVEAILPLHTLTEVGRGLTLFASKIAIVLLLLLVTFLVGYWAQHFFVQSLLQLNDYIFHRIPFVNRIYKATQDVFTTLFSPEHTHFSQVVLVPFPHSEARCIGLVTKPSTDQKVSVFVVGTPNPTMGFMLLYDREQVIFTDISVEEAFKFLLSCGVIPGPFKKMKTD